tara:strand:+ start:8127 stop:9062 length:936 start_codon:yes stop_codon:yes gene_type:complete
VYVLNFVYCFDQNYNYQALTSINSLIQNSSEKIRIYIIHNDVNSINLDLIAQDNVEIFTYQIKIENMNFPNLKGAHVSIATYFRLFLSKYLPSDLDYIIYMDSDIVCINDPTKEINKTIKDLKTNNFHLAARTEAEKNSENIDRFINLELKGKRYFNAGVLVLDYQKWLNDETEKKLLNILNEYYEKIKFWDQDILNKYFDDNYLELNFNCNYEFAIFNKEKYDENKIKNEGIFIHFNGKGKPWDSHNLIFDSSNFYQKAFRELNIGHYHITLNKDTKSIFRYIKILFTLKFLKLENPTSYLKDSLKALLR